MDDRYSCIFTLIHLKSHENNINNVKTHQKPRSFFNVGHFVSTKHMTSRRIDQRCQPRITNSCIDIYAHSCLKPFSIGRKQCSNSKTHVQIMEFTCRLNMGFGRRHWSMRRDVMCFVETKWSTLRKLCGFR